MPPHAVLPTPEEMLRMYRAMVLSRVFEETAAEMYARDKITGFLHLYSGQEAVGAGALQALQRDDYVITAYRDHAHALMRGLEPGRVMAELFGRRTGVSKGKGGSMHLFDAEQRLMGGYAIVGGHLPIAAGLAFSVAYRRGGEVVACLFGDGAVNEGTFHEALNLASLWRLPVLWLCENNFYGIGTHVRRASAVEEASRRAAAYGIPGESVDGMDPLAVYDAVRRAADRARAGDGGSLVEARTYRFRGHSMSDPDRYRTRAELALWRERDPIPRFAAYLLGRGFASKAGLEEIDREVDRVVADAVRFADESPPPDAREVCSDVYVEHEAHWR